METGWKPGARERMPSIAMRRHPLLWSVACAVFATCGLLAQDAVPQNPYLAALDSWDALPAAVRDGALGGKAASGDEIKNAPEQLAAMWAQLDAIAPTSEPVSWQTDGDPLARRSFNLRTLVRARLNSAQNPEERLAALRMSERIAQALQSNTSIMGRMVDAGIEQLTLSELAKHADTIDAAAARQLLAGLADGLDETHLIDALRNERAMFLEAPLGRLEAWRKARLAEAIAGGDWTQDYEVTALGHGQGDDLFIGFHEKSSGRNFQVWSHAPDEGIEILSVDVPHDRAIVSRDGVEAEVRLSDRRLGHWALAMSEDEVKAILGGLDMGVAFKTDREMEEFLKGYLEAEAGLEEFFAKLPEGPLSADAWQAIQDWNPDFGRTREIAKMWAGVRGLLYQARIKRDVMRTLLELRSNNQSWTSDTAQTRLGSMGVRTAIEGQTMKVTVPALPERNRDTTLDFILGGNK